MTFISESLLTKQTGGVRVIVSNCIQYPVSNGKTKQKRNAEREKEKKKAEDDTEAVKDEEKKTVEDKEDKKAEGT